MKLTTNYSLKKPEGSDVVNIDDFNYNSDLLDSKIKTIENQTNTNKGNINTLQTKVDNGQNLKLTQDNGLTINIAGRDLNTILTTMIASGNNMKNAPTGDWYYFEIISHSANSTMQIATKTTTTGSGVSGRRFIRTTESGGATWSTWKEFTTTSTIALEEQVLALQEENQALREELTQIQTSIASLTSLIATTLEEK